MLCKLLVFLFLLQYIDCKKLHTDAEPIALSKASLQANPPCSHSTVRFQNSTYFYQAILSGTVYQNIQYCRHINMELVSIESAAENNFLYNVIGSYLGISEFTFWTSGTQTTARNWVWLSTGEPIIYANWQANPTYDKSWMAVKYDRTAKTLTWNSYDYTDQYFLICEKRLEEPIL